MLGATATTSAASGFAGAPVVIASANGIRGVARAYELITRENKDTLDAIIAGVNIEELDPEFEGMPIVRKRIDRAKIDTVLSNSFGFGGTNATLIFQRYSA